MRRFTLIIVMAVCALGLTQQAQAQSEPVVTDVGVYDDFGQHVTFEARIQTPVPILSVDLVFSENFDDIERRFPRSLKNLLTEFRAMATHCACFMNDGDKPVPIFEQEGGTRKIYHDTYLKLITREAGL